MVAGAVIEDMAVDGAEVITNSSFHNRNQSANNIKINEINYIFLLGYGGYGYGWNHGWRRGYYW